MNTRDLAVIRDMADGDLSQLQVMNADLVAEYWSPEDGEVRRCLFLGIDEQLVQDFNDKTKRVPLKCVLLAFQTPTGWRRMCNGSKRLVAVFEDADVPENSAFEITYFGREKNRSNNNSSGRWGVVPLMVPKVEEREGEPPVEEEIRRGK